MQLLIFAGLLQAIAITPPPALTGPVPAPPLVAQRMASYLPVADRATPRRDTIDVEIRAASEILWAGTMIVSNQQASTFSRQLSGPPPADCMPRNYGDHHQDSLSMEMTSRSNADDDSIFNVTLRWGRSLPGTCPYRNSSRTVELSERITLAPDQTITLKGDAGLTVRLHRR